MVGGGQLDRFRRPGGAAGEHAGEASAAGSREGRSSRRPRTSLAASRASTKTAPGAHRRAPPSPRAASPGATAPARRSAPCRATACRTPGPQVERRPDPPLPRPTQQGPARSRRPRPAAGVVDRRPRHRRRPSSRVGAGAVFEPVGACFTDDGLGSAGRPGSPVVIVADRMPETPQGRPARGRPCTPRSNGRARVTTRTSSTSEADGIAKITINRPERRNAFRPPTLAELRDAFKSARDDLDVGVDNPDRGRRPGLLLGRRSEIRGDDGYIGSDEVARQGVGRLDVGDLHVQIRRTPSRSWRWSPAMPSAAATSSTSSAI